MKKFQKISTILLLVFLPVIAQAAEKMNNGFAELTVKLDAIKHLQANFSQRTLSESGDVMQSFSGVLKFSKPGLFYWQADDPYAQQLISDGKTIWHYDPDLEQVLVQSYQQQKSQAPLLLILEQSERLKEGFELSNVINKSGKQLYELQAKNNSSGLSFLLLQFEKGKLNSVSFVDQLKQRTEIFFTDVSLKAANPSIFSFDIPDGVDVLYE
jgi:outer membrane lipoprotein carrier protein